MGAEQLHEEQTESGQAFPKHHSLVPLSETVLVCVDHWCDPEGISYVLMKDWPSVLYGFSKNDEKSSSCMCSHLSPEGRMEELYY